LEANLRGCAGVDNVVPVSGLLPKLKFLLNGISFDLLFVSVPHSAIEVLGSRELAATAVHDDAVHLVELCVVSACVSCVWRPRWPTCVQLSLCCAAARRRRSTQTACPSSLAPSSTTCCPWCVCTAVGVTVAVAAHTACHCCCDSFCARAVARR
jgi:hypothetical protein